MAQRRTFFAQADLFETNVGVRAKLILTYLCRVSNRQGVSFPSIPTIAEKCGCCPNTARKAIRELEQAGLITVAPAAISTRRGKLRRTSNRYTLLFVPAKSEGDALQPLQGGPSRDGGDGYNSKLTTAVPQGHSPSVKATDQDGDADREETGLKAILSRLQLDLFEDKTFAKGIRHALRHMYHAESIRVQGEVIPRAQVRSVLELLTIDHIDFVERQLREAVSEVTCGERFLISCLYNAPLDCLARSRIEAW